LSSHGKFQRSISVKDILDFTVKGIVLGGPGGGVILDSLSEGGKVISSQGSGEGTLCIREGLNCSVPCRLCTCSSRCEGSSIASSCGRFGSDWGSGSDEFVSGQLSGTLGSSSSTISSISIRISGSECGGSVESTGGTSIGERIKLGKLNSTSDDTFSELGNSGLSSSSGGLESGQI
jgi:hypothetical protein